jgi:hypothetical protein
MVEEPAPLRGRLRIGGEPKGRSDVRDSKPQSARSGFRLSRPRSPG